ncbi:alpha-L-fucosidase 1-like [Tasmannia lanceolata]|uniref:alpha-L-fucosidase 1-like n=1 Tax=Tasmannia lanceolata TaxID=3420 RepID=UPI00406435D2
MAPIKGINVHIILFQHPHFLYPLTIKKRFPPHVNVKPKRERMLPTQRGMEKVWFWFLILFQALEFAISKVTPPPLPVLPLPTAAQLKWQRREVIMFHHFGVNTFTDSEWGTGHENPSIFNPTALDARQWVDVAAYTGVSLVILTAKHHDGFCLWPSLYTNHSVERSPWKDGKGDVVRELVDAAKARGIDVGLYLSPWDRHEKSYGLEQQYNEFYLGQLQELLNKYGTISEIWFDGAKGSNAPNMTYYFGSWFSMVKELQGAINVFSDAGPDVRWVGDEMGYAGTTCWSTINRTSLRIGDGSIVGYLNKGDPRGTDWVPPECDVSIRKGWFWHKSESPKKLSQLLEIYYNSVGRNCVLLINVPPNTSGLISGTDIQRLQEFRNAIDTIFTTNLAVGSVVKASSQRGGKKGSFTAENVLDDDHLWTYWAPEEGKDEHWIEFSGIDKGLIRFNVVRIQEAIGLGQRIARHEIFADGSQVANGTTVGYKKLHRLDKIISARRVKIRIVKSRGLPLLSSVGLHLDPFWNSKHQNGTWT